MMSIVTHVHLREGAGRDWDAAMRTRLSAAKKASGWVGGQLLRPADKPDRRVIVDSWRTRANWEAWHRQATAAAQRHPAKAQESRCSRDPQAAGHRKRRRPPGSADPTLHRRPTGRDWRGLLGNARRTAGGAARASPSDVLARAPAHRAARLGDRPPGDL